MTVAKDDVTSLVERFLTLQQEKLDSAMTEQAVDLCYKVWTSHQVIWKPKILHRYLKSDDTAGRFWTCHGCDRTSVDSACSESMLVGASECKVLHLAMAEWEVMYEVAITADIMDKSTAFGVQPELWFDIVGLAFIALSPFKRLNHLLAFAYINQMRLHHNFDVVFDLPDEKLMRKWQSELLASIKERALSRL